MLGGLCPGGDFYLCVCLCVCVFFFFLAWLYEFGLIRFRFVSFRFVCWLAGWSFGQSVGQFVGCSVAMIFSLVASRRIYACSKGSRCWRLCHRSGQRGVGKKIGTTKSGL